MITMTFEKAFETFILGKKIISCGFQQPVKTLLPNGFHAYPAGYFTVYENNYKLILGHIQNMGKAFNFAS